MHIIHAIKALKDNYIWAIHSPENTHVVVVDPGVAEPVITYLKKKNLILDGILLTHHHLDHTGGVATLLEHFPSIPVIGSYKDKVPGISHFVQEGEKVFLANLGLTLNIIEIPGHTLGHIAYYDGNNVFCGDTLFSCGCGKIFEGTPLQMYHSLEKLKKLPLATQIYCGHEYTLANIAFAKVVDPNNLALEDRRKQVEACREKDLPSLPVSLETELQTNPFLRCEQGNIKTCVQNHFGVELNSPILVFSHLREWKNQF